jgi:hypothetical protein
MPFKIIPLYTSSLPSTGSGAVPEEEARLWLVTKLAFRVWLYFSLSLNTGEPDPPESAIVFDN